MDARVSGRRDFDVPQARMHAVPAAGLCRRLSQVVLSQRDSLLKRSPVMFMFENKQDLASLRGTRLLVKANKNGLEFSFENE